MRSKLPPIICCVCGIVLLLQFFIPWKPIQNDMMEWVANSTQVVGVFALAIGLASLVHMHGNKIIRNAPGWGFSVITLLCMVIVLFIGLVPPIGDTEDMMQTPHDAAYVTRAGRIPRTDIRLWPPAVYTTPVADIMRETGETNRYITTVHTIFGFQPTRDYGTYVQTISGDEYPLEYVYMPMFRWVFQYIFFTLTSTTFSLLAFYMMTATYRAVRVKSWESGLLLVAAIIVLIGQVPMEQIPFVGRILSGGQLGGISTFEYLKGIILQYPNTAAKRAIILGISLGGLATGVKIIFGIEKPYMGGRN